MNEVVMTAALVRTGIFNLIFRDPTAVQLNNYLLRFQTSLVQCRIGATLEISIAIEATMYFSVVQRISKVLISDR
jgi:uncharacterized membrane protein AbrB (regulator of aidB expression)